MTCFSCSVTQSNPTICNPEDCNTAGFIVLQHLPELAQTHVHWVDDAIQPPHPLHSLLLLPSIFPSIRVISNESALPIRWPKYWSFNFSISPPNEYSALISFIFFLFICISWRLITLQYCSGFCHTLTWISHGFTRVPHPEPPSHLSPHFISLGHPSAPALSTCLMHPTWAGDLFHT